MLGDPNYGCNLINRIFQYAGMVISDLCKDDILDAVSIYEPRVSMGKDDIIIDVDVEKRTANIYIMYKELETGISQEFSFVVQDMNKADNLIGQ